MSPFLLLALTAKSGPLEQTLPSGDTVYLSYVGQGNEGTCWRPDGHPSAPFWPRSAEIGDLSNGHVKLHDGDLELILTLKLKKNLPETRSPDGSSWKWVPTVPQIDPAHFGYGWFTVPCALGPNEWYIQRILARPSSPTLDVTVRVAYSDYKEVDQVRFRGGKKVSGGSFIKPLFDLSKTFGKSGKGEMHGFPYEVPTQWQDHDWKFVALDRAGFVVAPAGTWKTQGKSYTFFSNPKKVDQIKLMVRPFAKVTFKNIHTQPDGA